ncbi:MAG TPA: group II intron maturase-specific domain-containing protein [Pseudonocardiaceae bacterium]
MRARVRRWRLHLGTQLALEDLAQQVNPVVRGWMQYYGAFYRSALDPLLKRINAYLVRFLRRKFERLRRRRKALACWMRITQQQPTLFAHWAWSTALW